MLHMGQPLPCHLSRAKKTTMPVKTKNLGHVKGLTSENVPKWARNKWLSMFYLTQMLIVLAIFVMKNGTKTLRIMIKECF